MIGKIIGVALVGLTQFALWVMLTLLIVTVFFSVYSREFSSYRSDKMQLQENPLVTNNQAAQMIESGEFNESLTAVFDSMQSINFVVLIFSFLFYFAGGYLLYGALFAAIGSAVDSETDTQQFMLPITMPLILSIAISEFLMVNPDGPAAFWLSIFPLTSPVIMMIRIPFGVPYYQILLSVALLILGFIAATWLAAKIYRTGILMYGKKITYSELWKWIKFK